MQGAVYMVRFAALTLVAGLATGAVAVSANSAPMLPNPHQGSVSNIIQVAGGCGPAYHRNYQGFCVPNEPYYGGYVRPYYPPVAPRRCWDPYYQRYYAC